MAKKPTTVAPVPEVFARMFKQTMTMLDVLNKKCGLEYSVYSAQLEVNEATEGMARKVIKKTKKRESNAPHGAMALVYKPVLQNMLPDAYASIPVGTFNPLSVQSAVSARASTMWGTKSYSCVVTKDKKHVEIWRFPDDIDTSLLSLKGLSCNVGAGQTAADDE